MSPAAAIAMLDRFLAKDGEDVILRRSVGPINIDVTVRANVRPFRPEELIGGIEQADSKVVISPTQILNAQWPGGAVPKLPPFNEPPWLPRPNDGMIIQGRFRAVGFVKPMAMGGQIVRIELTVG